MSLQKSWLPVSYLAVMIILTTPITGQAEDPEKQQMANKTQTPAITEHLNIEYASGPTYQGTKGNLDVYAPPDAPPNAAPSAPSDAPSDATNLPVMVFIHGGALSFGDKSMYAKVDKRFAADGFVVVGTNYRVSPTVSYPGHVQDIAKAIRWTHDNISEFGGDPARIVVAGHSAGGHLAALVALDGRFLEEVGLSTDVLAGAISVSGFFDVRRVPEGRMQLKAVFGGEDEASLLAASPWTYVRADAPPLLFLYADDEVPGRPEDTIDTYNELKRLGHTDLQIGEVADRGHRSIIREMVDPADPGAALVVSFIQKYAASQ